jgi:hypothetical protein
MEIAFSTAVQNAKRVIYFSSVIDCDYYPVLNNKHSGNIHLKRRKLSLNMIKHLLLRWLVSIGINGTNSAVK